MDDIDEFARIAANKFRDAQHGIDAQYYLGLSQPAVEQLVKTVYYASMIPDEGRSPSLMLMSYRKGSDFHFRFKQTRDCSAIEIAKLAHAVASHSHICLLCNNGEIAIGGIHLNSLNKRRDLGYSSGRVPNPLRLAIRAPGHMEVSTDGVALVYKAGQISEELLIQNSAVMQALVEAVGNKLKYLTSATAEGLKDVFNDLVKGIVRLGHGGMILFADQPEKAHFSQYKEVDCGLLQYLLVTYWNVFSAQLEATGGRANLLQADAPNPHSVYVASAASMLEDCIETIAHMSGLDGAIVLTYGAKVGAFNAIITNSSEPVATCRLIGPDGGEVSVEDFRQHRGTRHQSALAYVSNVPGAIAIIVSQDGSISALHNRGDGTVMCERDMRVLE